MAGDEAGPGANGIPGRSVFVSYRRLDDESPPEGGNGFVRYLSKQIQYELNQLGVPNAVLWRDRAKIAPGDNWSEAILKELQKADLFLAIVSRNYVTSTWCNQEVSTIASRATPTDPSRRRAHLFRVDKHTVPGDQIPEPLRGIEPVRLYEEDRENNRDDEYFWRGQVCNRDAYMNAIRQLADAIYARLRELGLPGAAPPAAQQGHLPAGPIVTGTERAIFVAKPAKDLSEEYRTLTRELMQRGCRIVPDPDRELPSEGEQALAVIEKALVVAEFSVHLLGERRGFRPDGLDQEIVPLQLAAAAKEVGKRPKFQRLIWAPKILRRYEAVDSASPIRDPFEVLSGFDDRLESDQVDGDTAARFNEFVVQRIEAKGETPAARNVYVHCAPIDRADAVNIAKELKQIGLSPLMRPQPGEGSIEEVRMAEGRLLNRAHHSVVYWGSANHAQMLAELTDPILQNWKSQKPTARRIVLLIGPPGTEAKRELYELGIGSDADCVINASDQSQLTNLVKTQLAPALERG